tara:strand:- start:1193 stop:1774 length:582 start_codon:yes stop_codon:yes gene_type:complete
MLNKFIKIIRNIICIIGLLAILPLLLISALIIIAEDGLPFLFTQNRIGKNLLIFKIFKIRTLKVSSPNTGTHELDNSYRLLSGAIIRKIKLDEFPQLVNVLMGDINLIGPRPGLLEQIELRDARLLKDIYKIKPGITGLAQVLGYDMSDPIKLSEVDKIYIDNQSFVLDLLILISTFIKYPRKYLMQYVKQEL